MTAHSMPARKTWRRVILAASGALLVLLVLALLAWWQPSPTWGLALAAALGAAVLVTAWRWPLALLGLILVFIPLYDGILRYLTHVAGWPADWLRALSLWKEGGLLLLFAVVLIQHVTGRRRIRWRWYPFDLWLAALLLLSVVYIGVAARPGIGVYGLRNYALPLALFFLARLMAYSRRDVQRLVAVLLLVGAGVAVLGIYQARALSFSDMIALGYVDEAGGVPHAFRTALRPGFRVPRAVSTTTGPNQFAVYLNWLILVCLFGVVYLRSRAQRILLGGLAALFLATLLLTLSRGGLLALLVALAAWGVLLVQRHGVRRSWRELTQNRLLLAGLAALVVFGAVGAATSGFAQRIVRGFTGEDSSANAHESSIQHTIAFIAEHPLGIGTGMVGERALQFADEAAVEHTESSYLQVAMELGIPGLLLLLITLGALLAALWRMRSRASSRGDPWSVAVVELALVFWIGAMVDFVFTPLLQNLLAAGYLWWAAGTAFHHDIYEV